MKRTAFLGASLALCLVSNTALAALTMQFVSYPYQPAGSAPVGGGLSSLAFSLDGSTAYTITTDNYEANRLYGIDPDTGAGTDIAESGSNDHITDLATQPGTGTVFGSYWGDLVTIDTATGALTTLGSVLPDVSGGLAFAADGTLYMVGDGELYTINPLNGDVLSTTAISNGEFFMGLAYEASSGLLWGSSRSNFGDIYTIDPTTGLASLIASFSGTGVCPGTCYIHDLDFRPGTGDLYGVMGGSAGNASEDNLTGAFVRFEEVAVPVPATGLLLPAGLLLMSRVRRRAVKAA